MFEVTVTTPVGLLRFLLRGLMVRLSGVCVCLFVCVSESVVLLWLIGIGELGTVPGGVSNRNVWFIMCTLQVLCLFVCVFVCYPVLCCVALCCMFVGRLYSYSTVFYLYSDNTFSWLRTREHENTSSLFLLPGPEQHNTN